MKTIVEIRFGGHHVPHGDANTILGPSQCGPDVVKTKEYTWYEWGKERPGLDVEITLDEKDPRAEKVLALLAEHGAQHWVDRKDEYTEDELQAAPLLVVLPWQDVMALAATTYDESQACPRCGTGRRQTSALNISFEELKQSEKRRIAFTTKSDVLVHDVDVERLLAAGVTGALFWPVYAKNKAGDLEELRRQQMFIEHVMPPMSPKSFLNRKQVCPDCRRGWYTQVMDYPVRFVYRREDLTNIQDVNVTWEWFGEPPFYMEHIGMAQGPRHPWVLVTPKVMNLLRGKTKKEAKHQGCVFKPIWIEDEKHEHPYPQA